MAAQSGDETNPAPAPSRDGTDGAAQPRELTAREVEALASEPALARPPRVRTQADGGARQAEVQDYRAADERPEVPARDARRVADRQVIDDDALKDIMRDEEPSFLDEYWYSLATIALIAVNVVVFVVEFVKSGFSPDISTQVLIDMGAMYAPAIQGPADLVRFITPMFLHMGPLHLLMNMVALYSVGEALEYVIGKPCFVLLYFVAGVTGNVVSYLADMLFGTGYTVSAGASTSVFGLFVAVAMLAVLCRGNREELLDYSKGMLAVIGVNVVYTLLVPGISVSGHLGGAVGGLIGILMVPSRNLRTPAALRIVVAVAWAAALVAVVATTGVFG